MPASLVDKATEERLARILDSAAELLYGPNGAQVDAVAVSTRLAEAPGDALSVWRCCKRLAVPRGLRASALVKGRALTLRFHRPGE